MKKYTVAISFGMLLALSGNHTYAFNVLQFKNFVQVSPFADGETWFLTQPLVYEIHNTHHQIIVPDGFVTDFASIPQPFWSILPTWGKYGPPSVVHDFLYWDQQCTREQADDIFLAAMKEAHVGRLRRFFIHLAVRVGGSMSWKANKEHRASGKWRVFSELDRPKDPTVTWHDFQPTLPKEPERIPADYCEALDKQSPTITSK